MLIMNILDLFLETNFKDNQKSGNVNEPFGCFNDFLMYKIKSLLSSPAIQVTFHYGKGCFRYVLSQFQGGKSSKINPINCPESIFVKLHRSASC